MKKENSINSQKCLEMDLNEISLAQLILENFAVNKETYKILLDIMYGDEEVEHEDDAQDDGPWYVVESDKNEDSNRAK